MAIIKCKMCGGDLNIEEGFNVAECEYCGSKQTVPSADNEKKMTLFARANRLRAACEFDKAAGVYESIVAEFPEEAEAYWGLLLCKFGIEYVDDPATGKKIPTCHRSSFDSIMDDSDFEQVMENADAISRRVYREEAKQIEELRKSIIEVSSKEEPYDIFICYKETDENGGRTIDSVIAQDIYNALTEKGYKVFFSRITLEDKLGQEYEPYIFAALNSAKVMLAFGTDYEYYNAVWVKNEWSRFLALIAKGEKKTLIPCYKDIDAYDMPKEFKHLQAQDMGKVGAKQDLLRGIGKIIPKTNLKRDQKTSDVKGISLGPNVDSLLRRAYMFLEDEDWENADEYFQKVLDIDPENAEAYLGLAIRKSEMPNKESFAHMYIKTDSLSEINGQLRRAKQFGSADISEWIMELEKKRAEWFAELERKRAELEAERESKRKAQIEMQTEANYAAACALQASGKENELLRACELFAGLADYKDSIVRATNCRHTYEALKTEREEREKAEKQAALDAKKERLKTARERIANYSNRIAVCSSHIVGIKMDGTLVAVGENNYGQLKVSGWTDIVSVAVGEHHTVGLRKDGTVVVAGKKDSAQCRASEWEDIKAIAVGDYHTVGLKKDGKAVAVGENEPWNWDVSKWKDITMIAARGHTVGLKDNGKVVAVGTNDKGQCNVSHWKEIVAIAAGDYHTVGLRADGTVIAVGSNDHGQCNVSEWWDIIAIAAGCNHTIGLKAGGTIVAVGDNGYKQCDVSIWNNSRGMDTIAIAAGGSFSIGLRANGKVVAVGENKSGKCDVSDWKLFSTTAELNSEKTALQTELANLKGIFSGKRRKEIEARLAQIDNELKKL